MSLKTRLLLVFFFSFAFLLFYQASPIFADPDSFYHAGVAKLMAQGAGVIDDFPWLPISILSENYIDHHFLYHVALVPFSFTNALAGIKIATALFGALFMTLFARLLFSLGVRYPELFALLLLLNHPFAFRISLAKASAFSLLFLFSGLFALIKRNHFVTAIVGFLYVWAYDGWVLYLGVLGLYWLVDAFATMVYKQQVVSLRDYFRLLVSRSSLSLIAAGIGGVLAGVVVNPFFPKNLIFYQNHIIKIGLLGYKHLIQVGGEWYGYNPFLFLGNNAILMAVFILACVAFIATMKKQTSESLVSFTLSVVFVVATLRSQRNIEYAIPFLVLFCALSFRGIPAGWMKKQIVEHAKKWPWLLLGYGAVFALVFSVTRDSIMLRGELANGFRFDYLQTESLWIRERVKPSEIIFHSNWDEFPSLFYQNPDNAYIVGLDPAFMYAFDEQKYALWKDITQGVVKDHLRETIQTEFGAQTVLASNNHTELQTNLISSGFTRVYEGRDATIFQADFQ